jgi:glycosyltransferase involved in cell wall biosynthesis
MRLAVVVPVRNEERHLPAQVETLLAQEWDGEWEIVVVDNGSTDGTADVVRRYASRDPRVRYLLADDVADQSFAANAGVEATSADAVVFCDADDLTAPGWLSAMARGLAEHDVVTGVEELDRLNPPWLANSRGRAVETSLGTFSGIFPLVLGNNYGVRRDVWEMIGPLQVGFAKHGVLADQEFSLRCWLHGIDIALIQEAVVHYRYRPDAQSLWRQGFAYGSHRPLIARLLREAGGPPAPSLAGWKSWLLLLVRTPTVVTRAGRARWLWIAGNRAGQVVGSIRHRSLML